MDFEFTKKNIGLLLKKYKYWTLYLSPKQYYLGKLRVVLNRKGIIDFCDLEAPEITELLKIITQSKKALTKCFHPDLFNYATLGNCVRQHHWHIIPRYKSQKVVDGVIFKDKHWNHPSWPNPHKKISKRTMQKIKTLILDAL
jgi:diadenosine tetraphosphate (Ap4A) HIT family hydrolase